MHTCRLYHSTAQQLGKYWFGGFWPVVLGDILFRFTHAVSTRPDDQGNIIGFAEGQPVLYDGRSGEVVFVCTSAVTKSTPYIGVVPEGASLDSKTTPLMFPFEPGNPKAPVKVESDFTRPLVSKARAKEVFTWLGPEGRVESWLLERFGQTHALQEYVSQKELLDNPSSETRKRKPVDRLGYQAEGPAKKVRRARCSLSSCNAAAGQCKRCKQHCNMGIGCGTKTHRQARATAAHHDGNHR